MRVVDNPKNRFETSELVFDEGGAPLATLEIHEEDAKSIIAENRSPDIPFRYSVNPYRGCQHACAYCYARPSHQYWGLGAGTDFERKLIVKTNAAALLEAALARPRFHGEPLAFSGNTDCYQPLEGRYRLTRALLERCAAHGNPVSVITKSALVQRDTDVLQTLARKGGARVFVSIPFANEADARAIEPGAASIARRLSTLETLSAAGVETGVAVAPLIPGLNDSQISEILRRARDAGATRAFTIALRLPAEVQEVFLRRLEEVRPGAVSKVTQALREIRGGRLNDPRFGSRMRGRGPRWQAIEDLFALETRRLGLSSDRAQARASAGAGGPKTATAPSAKRAAKRPPRPSSRQLALFSTRE